MFDLLAISWKHYAFSIPLALLSVFLMLVILVQRGRGGGLTGALGGMGGQSAFGTKAGDLFTRITIAVAAVWILLCMLSLKVLNDPRAAEAAAPPPARVGAEDPTKTGEPDATKAPAGTAPDGKAAEGKTGESGKAGPDGTGSTAPAAAGTTAPATPAAAPATPAPTTTPPADDATKTKP